MTFFRFFSALLTCAALYAAYQIADVAFSGSFKRAEADYRAVFWPSEDKLVLLSEKDIVLHKSDGMPARTVIFQMPKDLSDTHVFRSGVCFSETLWAISLTRVDGSMRSTGGTLYISVDGTHATGFKHLSSKTGEKTHPFDCQLVTANGHNISVRGVDAETSNSQTRIHNTLISAGDAQNVSLLPSGSRSVIDYENDGLRYRMILGPNRTSNGGWSTVVRDPNAPRYLFYQWHIDAGGRPELWPMDVWIADFANHAVTQVSFPPGPWVREQKERTRCFSCGCACYRKLNLYLAGDNIYGHVWGIGYPAGDLGIYEFNLTSDTRKWQKVTENAHINSVTFSKSGCKLAYTTDELVIKNLCE